MLSFTLACIICFCEARRTFNNGRLLAQSRGIKLDKLRSLEAYLLAEPLVGSPVVGKLRRQRKPFGRTTRLRPCSESSPDAPAALAFSFTPAGLLFPYYVGVAYKLRDLGLLLPTSPVGGGSAGAIVAAAVACGVSEKEVLLGLENLVADVRAGVRLNVALRKQLDLMLADDAHESAQEHGLKVGYLEVLPRPGRRVVEKWTSKQDLIDTIAASCNWPFFFSRWPFVVCRRSWCLDGFFAVESSRFGCPVLNAERQVAVTALPRVSLTAFDESDVIQPDRFPSAPLPITDSEWFRYAMKPASDALIDDMVRLGRNHAILWNQAQQ